MNPLRIVHFVAGTLVLTGIALGYFVHENWLLLSAFVGANLLQFSLTKWCPLVKLLGLMGIRESCPIDK